MIVELIESLMSLLLCSVCCGVREKQATKDDGTPSTAPTAEKEVLQAPDGPLQRYANQAASQQHSQPPQAQDKFDDKVDNHGNHVSSQYRHQSVPIYDRSGIMQAITPWEFPLSLKEKKWRLSMIDADEVGLQLAESIVTKEDDDVASHKEAENGHDENLGGLIESLPAFHNAADLEHDYHSMLPSPEDGSSEGHFDERPPNKDTLDNHLQKFDSFRDLVQVWPTRLIKDVMRRRQKLEPRDRKSDVEPVAHVRGRSSTPKVVTGAAVRPHYTGEELAQALAEWEAWGKVLDVFHNFITEVNNDALMTVDEMRALMETDGLTVYRYNIGYCQLKMEPMSAVLQVISNDDQALDCFNLVDLRCTNLEKSTKVAEFVFPNGFLSLRFMGPKMMADALNVFRNCCGGPVKEVAM
eukprot:gnl/MRDRNA2_/MRDRNA2_199925_c0_seq1.p1 gnl/MRDRNA2_/MRDRNA2_199925_c0~~gnl/MRDRNA2_/MRDRNA2_199925_c0_seq1.p1  ORF type:complete len:411 (+),score=99.71 gnl/MRDRNA2_/MRDRNA2_199925_c0_seq1:58-1290(+)